MIKTIACVVCCKARSSVNLRNTIPVKSSISENLIFRYLLYLNTTDMKKLFAATPLLALLACNSASIESKPETTFDLEAAKTEIKTNNQQFEQAVEKGDSTAAVALYHSDAKVFPPNMESVDRNKMGGMIAGLQQMGIKKFRLNSTEFVGGPEVVVEIGTYEMSDSAKEIDKGKFFV